MKINGKLIKEGFEDAFDSSLIDYSGDFEKSDKTKLEEGFLDNLYILSQQEADNIYYKLKNISANRDWVKLRSIINDESEILFNDNADTLTLYITLKGNITKNFVWAGLMRTVFGNCNTNLKKFGHNTYDPMNDLIDFSSDVIDSQGDGFFEKWNKIIENDRFDDKLSSIFMNAIDGANEYINQNTLLVYISDEYKKFFKGKELHIVFKFNTPYYEINKIVDKGYRAIIDYYKKNPDDVLKQLMSYNSQSISDMFKDKHTIYYNFDKGTDYIVKGLNKLKTIDDIDEFLAEVIRDNSMMLSIFENKLKWNKKDIDRFITAWTLFINGFGIPEHIINDPSMGKNTYYSRINNFLLNGIELDPIKCTILSKTI